MKNLLISLLTILGSFLITTFVLNQFKTSGVTVSNPANTTQQEQMITEETQEDDLLEQEGEANNSLLEDNNNNQELEETTNKLNTLEVSQALANYDTWKMYHKKNIDLATDFIAVDTDGNETTKKEFLEALKTGEYVPVKLHEAEYMYQLHEIDATTDEKISKSIKSSAGVIYSYYSKENKAFPEFNFTDIYGNLYTNQNTLGNILVIECWFIQCTACIQEFPKANELYDRYEGHEDVIFLSLAFDKEEKLKKFLAKKEFRYPVVPDQKKFIQKELEVIQYPTHLIVDKYGDIKKMVNNVDSLILALDTMVNGELINDNM